MAALGERCAGLFTGCKEHTPRPTVIAAAEAVRDADADLIVSMGGGTVFDTVKILQLCLAAGVRTADDMERVHLQVGDDGAARMADVGPSPVRPIAVPTTLSGAEFSSLGAATNPETGAKEPYLGTDICPQAVILDPAATLATPENLCSRPASGPSTMRWKPSAAPTQTLSATAFRCTPCACSPKACPGARPMEPTSRPAPCARKAPGSRPPPSCG